MGQNRWHANKLGLINFWYYDEQEFCFAKGRLLLRGSNGSGKSVTMQSAIPLLLDGNANPERLDPFGSHDRKMSGYLLEEGDVSLRDEEDYMELAEKGGYDLIFADPCMKRMTKSFSGVFVDTVHFAVSGKCR